MDKQKFVLMLVSILGLTLVLSLAVWINRNDNSPNYTMTVSAQGEVIAKPDVAVINFGVKTPAKQNIEDVVADNTQKMNKILEALKNQKIAENDIKTINYNLYPVYDYLDSGRTLKGYELDQQVQVKIRDMSQIGETINVVTRNGANQVSNVNFTVDDPEELKNEARKEAIDKAKQKAIEMAKMSGVKLVRVINVSENFGGGDYPVYDSYMVRGLGGAEMEKSPEIAIGESEISVTVNLTYEVK